MSRVLDRGDCAENAANRAGSDRPLKRRKHVFHFFIFFALRTDQQEIEHGKHQDHGDDQGENVPTRDGGGCCRSIRSGSTRRTSGAVGQAEQNLRVKLNIRIKLFKSSVVSDYHYIKARIYLVQRYL